MAPKDPLWGHKLGDCGRPAFSPYTPPSLDSEYGPLLLERSSDMTPVVDADKAIYFIDGARSSISKVDPDGTYIWRVASTKERGGFGGSLAMADGTIFGYTGKGFAVAVDAETGKERWARRYAVGGSVIDQSAALAHKGLLILPGKDDEEEESLAFHRVLFALDAKTGAEKWKISVKLGLSQVVPSMIDNLLIFQTITGEVACHSLENGAPKWTSKPAGQVSSGGAVVCKETGLVYSTCNLRAKKEWNKPRGGRGALRAFDLKTGELKWQEELETEANALPAVAPCGPGKQMLVIFGIGANPGTWKEPTGDLWGAGVVAHDAKTGKVVWKSEGKYTTGHGPGGTNTEDRFKEAQAVCWSCPAVSGNGRVFIGWHGCQCFELDGATGQQVSELQETSCFSAGPVIAPGLLVVCSQRYLYIYRNRPIKGDIVRDLEIPLSESGCEHFWPSKMNTPARTEYSELPATTDLTGKPAWVAGDVEKHYARLPGNDFYHKTPVVDSQRNVYVATNASRLLIIRPDGTLRGTVHLGPYLGNPCLHERYLYVCNGACFVLKLDIETLEVVMNRQYCSYCASDSWNPIVVPKYRVLLTVGNHWTTTSTPVGGNRVVFGLNIDTGAVLWYAPSPYLIYNFLPTVYEEEDRAIWADNAGGLYCRRISDGTELWQDLTIPENHGAFTTGHCCSGPNRVIYNAYNLKTPDGKMGVWNKGAGAGGCIRANSADTGERLWLHHFDDIECHVAPVVVSKGANSEGYLVVVVQGSQGGYAPPGDGSIPSDESEFWPSGDAWEAWITALDADNGDELWRYALPTWRHYEARGSYVDDIFLPDCFGSPTANITNNVYVVHWSGTAYCVEGATGKVISETDVRGSSQSAPIILPGTLLLPQCYNVVAYRDEKLELDWLEEARAKGDKRADPRLWVHREQALTQKDKEAIDLALHVGPTTVVFPKTTYKVIGAPTPAFSQKTYDAKNARQLAKLKGEPPPEWAVDVKPTAPDGESPLWEVVGGGKAGGITVRKGEGLKTAELGRLSTGAKVKQLALKGERLHYEKLEGEGPDFGWVSLTFKGADLVKRVAGADLV